MASPGGGGSVVKNKWSLFAALCALVVLISASRQVIDHCRYGLSLCVELILPSLFPFFILSGLLSRLGLARAVERLLSPLSQRLPVSGAGISALLIGLTGGYPLGAAHRADLVRGGEVTNEEAERLLAFCNNSGPAFLIGAVGTGVFGSPGLGLVLYGVHIAAALLTALLFRKTSAPLRRRSAVPPLPFAAAFSEAVRQAVVSVLSVCGFVVCFTVFTGLLDANGFLSAAAGALSALLGTELHWSRALLIGFWELGGGIGALQGLQATPLNLALAAALVGWGGLSVHFQTLAAVADTEIKGTLHTAGRLCSALFSFLLAWIAGTLLL